VSRRLPTVRQVLRPAAVLLVFALAAAGCGGSGDEKRSSSGGGVSFEGAIADAQQVRASDFPPVRDRTLQQIAGALPAINVGLATNTFLPGTNRLAFGMIDQSKQFVYGKTAVYLARGPGAKALGPFPAPADPLVVDPPFRSRGAASEGSDIAAIYSASVRLPATGPWYVLAVTRNRGKLYGAATQLRVRASSPIPALGERPPRVATETRASAGGNLKAIETRVPPDDMHDVSFKDVLGKKPVALVFATPALCQTRVCGPVVDIAAQMEKEYGDRVQFIHQEVYVGNDISKGLRPPLRAFRLQTEPWLFTFDRRGRVAARVEGSFGSRAFRRALQAALG
jgi:hypothetical protein